MRKEEVPSNEKAHTDRTTAKQNGKGDRKRNPTDRSSFSSGSRQRSSGGHRPLHQGSVGRVCVPALHTRRRCRYQLGYRGYEREREKKEWRGGRERKVSVSYLISLSLSV